ncbi:uncharacterized protein EI97DRAFT_84943 [Westerdykella ornata]|uniref:Uncharacterized protein n=1 Tax=Westerdykella ornata TaxID=318751 RepID=A0A6A6JH94_WESOR|nr:uncharacterized protein EI97DRAFT_84943 [Westerdykella ornata]KAF2275016.1 hypothetical protein EI97DRAFT_84943 [Westerdykella ornata]
MVTTMASTSFTPYHSSPLASSAEHRASSPSTLRRTAKLWDEYERRAIENAKRRETTCGTPLQTPSSQRFSNGTLVDIIKSYDPTASAASTPKLDFDFPLRNHRHSTPSTSVPTTGVAVAICKACKDPIDSTSGVCEACMKTIIISPSSSPSTPLLSPCSRNFASTDLPKLHKESASGSTTPAASSSPGRKTYRPTSQLTDPPIRLSSLHALEPKKPSPYSATTSSQQSTRKASLTDPNEPFLRLQLSRKPLPATPHPLAPSTPSSAGRPSPDSGRRKRPSSLKPVPTPPQREQGHGHAHAHSVSHLPAWSLHSSSSHPSPHYQPSTSLHHHPVYHYPGSTRTSAPASLNRASYIQNAVSAWDDWDSDDEEEDKVGLVGYWKGRVWRGSSGSLAAGGHGEEKQTKARGKKKAKEGNGAKSEEEEEQSGANGKKGKKEKRRSVFVRVMSCGWLHGCGGEGR